EKLVVLGDVTSGLVPETVVEVVHAVRGQQGHSAAVEEIRTLARGHGLVLHVDTTTHLGVLGGGHTKTEVVPGVVGDVEGAARGVDLEKVEGASLVGNLHAKVVASDAAGPIGDA